MSMVNKCINGEVMSAEKQTVSNVIDLYNGYEAVVNLRTIMGHSIVWDIQRLINKKNKNAEVEEKFFISAFFYKEIIKEKEQKRYTFALFY